MWSPDAHSPNLNGPLPTGLRPKSCEVILLCTCSGSNCQSASVSATNGIYCCFRVTTAVVSFFTWTSAILSHPDVMTAPFFGVMIHFHVNAQSRMVHGAPSSHFNPGCIRRV